MYTIHTRTHSANTCFRKYLRFMQSACVECVYFCCIVAVAVVVVVYPMNTMTKICKTIYVSALVTAAAVRLWHRQRKDIFGLQHFIRAVVRMYSIYIRRVHVKEEKQQRR